MEKREITKQNGNIAFNESDHIYWDVTCPDQKICISNYYDTFIHSTI